MSREEFENAAGEALDLVPSEFMNRLTNIAIVVEDEPGPDQPANLLGLYEGVPLPERTSDWGHPTFPDRITLFQAPLQRICRDVEELREQIAVTLIHEIGHYFGIDDDRLHELGWG
ncbi:metallopeptidase family protein [Demetria terragena]|uniref:metallopeptidase family protein n=1 Tax=Demetria terragena TaxID=63959 RepID=UPI00058EFD30